MDKGCRRIAYLATYMKKVYDDPTLGYSQTETFKLPEGFDPWCGFGNTGRRSLEETGLDDLLS